MERKIRNVLAFGALCLAGCSGNEVQTSPLPPEGLPETRFQISSADTSFLAQSILRGTYRIQRNAIQISVEEGEVRIRPVSMYKEEIKLTVARVGLATGVRGKSWKPVRLKEAWNLNGVWKPGEIRQVRPVITELQLDSSMKLTEMWLMVEIEGEGTDEQGRTRQVFYYAHSEQNLDMACCSEISR